ncbi:MAG: hypothetical protein MJY45_02550 [Bacteroidales bacterium]|nr:hypothetical protein [Bacteroidales bacterium]
MSRIISVSDITMRNAGGDAACALSFREKLELARLLDRLGVSIIEAPPFSGSRTDAILIKSLSSSIGQSALAVPIDATNPEGAQVCWNALKEAARPRLQVRLPASTVRMEYSCHLKPDAVLALCSEAVGRCRELCPEVELVAEDFTRSDRQFLSKMITAAVQAGATVVTVCDLSGDLLPEEFAQTVSDIKSLLPETVGLGVECSNGLFLADTCAIAAVRAGADEIKTAVFGNFTASTERFTSILTAKSETCGACCGIKNTEIHHTAGQIKALFKPKNNKSVVRTATDRTDMRLTINDDKPEVLKAVRDLNYDLSEEDANRVFEEFVRLASKNGFIDAKELDAIVATVAFQVPRTYRLESYVINSGNTITATCHMRIRKGNELLEHVCVGDGPIDASFLAIEKAIGRHFELDDFQIQSVTEGREAMGETVVRLRHGDKIYSGRGISTDIVGSSIMAYISAINKIAFEEEEA